MAPQKKKWKDFTPRQRVAIVVAASVEVGLSAVALVDLARRPAVMVRGPKPIWIAGCVVQPFGPIAYLVFGRRAPSDRLGPNGQLG